MSNLPAKPDFSRAANARPEPGDDRRTSGSGRVSPDRYVPQRDDRDRDRDARDWERGSRSRYTPSGRRSPLRPRSKDSYYPGHRDAYHAREYRSHDDRTRDDRRSDRDRDRDHDRDRERDRGRERDRDRDRDRDWGYYRRDDTWTARSDYGTNRPTSSRRGYSHWESDWRGRDDYRRERNRERERSRDRDDQRPRDREYDRRPASPVYRPAPLSPRRDHHHEPYSLSRRAPPSYPSRGRRSTSPRSTGSRSRKSSPLSRTRPEPIDTRDIPPPPKSPSPHRRSPSPNRCPRSVSSPTRSSSERRSPETSGEQRHRIDETHREAPTSVSEPILGEGGPVEATIVLDGEVEAETTLESPSKRKDHSDIRDGGLSGRAESPRRTDSPMESQQSLIPIIETVALPSSETAVTQPYLPAIPRYEAKPRFSAAYESEYNRLEAHRAHAAAECRRCLKASRRAFHELEMTTLDLRAAQHRRELAESHRKKAHHGQLGIDAETVQ